MVSVVRVTLEIITTDKALADDATKRLIEVVEVYPKQVASAQVKREVIL